MPAVVLLEHNGGSAKGQEAPAGEEALDPLLDDDDLLGEDAISLVLQELVISVLQEELGETNLCRVEGKYTVGGT